MASVLHEQRHRHHVEEPWSTPNLAVNNHPYPPSSSSYYASASTVYDKGDVNLPKDGVASRHLARTPSPTPSEQKELKTGAFDWETLRKWRFWIRKEWIWYYVALVVICVVTALITIYHEQIVEWLTPVTKWLHELSWGWVVPILVLFVISFPPLFGHEIVAILCGLVWGLWIGFGIVAAGTFIGEVGNFYAFKYCCRARGEKMERTKLTYACLAKVVRDGGFKIALIARLSAIPGHFTTAVFSTCGMGIFVFSLAAILSLPKQFITVYLGVILEQSASGQQDPKSRIISNVVLAFTFLVTLVAMWYIYRQMNKVKPEVIYDRRKARQTKLAQSPYVAPYASTSEVHIPLRSPKAQYPFAPELQPTGGSPKADAYVYTPSHANEKLSQADEMLSPNLSHTTLVMPSKQSMEEVSWDAGRYAGSGSARAAYSPRTTPVSYPNPYDHPPSPRAQTPRTDVPYTSPTPTPQHHEAEPTGISYHTAREPSPPIYTR